MVVSVSVWSMVAATRSTIARTPPRKHPHRARGAFIVPSERLWLRAAIGCKICARMRWLGWIKPWKRNRQFPLARMRLECRGSFYFAQVLDELGQNDNVNLFRMKITHKKLGRNLRSQRRDQSLSQETLASKAGLKPTAISHFERGSRRPSLENFCKLCNALKIEPVTLLIP